MDRGQGIELVEYVGNLWQEYTFTQQETALYCEKLRPYELGVAKKAIGEYKASNQGRYKSPKLNEVIEHCKKVQQAKRMETIGGRSTDSVLLYSLRCIENKHTPRVVGQMRKFFAPSGQKIPTFEAAKQDAERMASRFNHSYRSRWVPVYGEIFSEETEDLPDF